MTIQSLSIPQPNPNLGFDTDQKHTGMPHMSEIRLASNPWVLGPLPASFMGQQGVWGENNFTSEEAYKSMCSFLNGWSGTATVALDHEQRHTRFVQIIGGYPLINNRFPLDWPLHPGSCKALRLSLFFDSIMVQEDCSLRTYILEKDLKFRIEYKKTLNEKRNMNNLELNAYLKGWAKLNKECTEIVIVALRNNLNLDDPLSAAEEAFLTSLHSTDSDRISTCWPPRKNGPLSPLEYHTQFFKKRPESKMPTPEEKISIPELRDQKQNDELEDLKKRDSDWKEFNERCGNRIEVNFELKYIQTWMNDYWLKNWIDKEDDDSIGQRFVRGLSVICEAAMASIRQEVIENYGVGSIVIDGGGRLSISVPKKKADKAQKLMIRAYGETFINNSRKPVSFLNQEIDEAFYAHVSLEERNRAYQDDNPDSLKDLREKIHGKNFVKSSLPPFRCYQRGNLSEAEIFDTYARDKSCKICDGTLENQKWGSLTKSLKTENWFCFMHRFAFFVGTNQRQRDSILRLSNTMNTGFPVKKSESEGVSNLRQQLRSVNHITIIDANSLGYIFSHEIENFGDESTPGNLTDVRRRRSFRFNALWYISLSNALQSTIGSGSDRVAAWVCAGDDLVLAQYGGADEDEPTIHDFLVNFDTELQQNFSETPLEITFAGSLAERKPGNKILSTYLDAVKIQKVAKLEWKNRVRNLDFDNDYLQTRNNEGELELKQFEKIKQEDWSQDADNLFTVLSKNDRKPRSLVLKNSLYPIEQLGKPKMDINGQQLSRPVRVRKTENDIGELCSYDEEFLKLK